MSNKSNEIILYYYQNDDRKKPKVLIPSQVLCDVSNLQKINADGIQHQTLNDIKQQLPITKVGDELFDASHGLMGQATKYPYHLYAQIIDTKTEVVLNESDAKTPIGSIYGKDDYRNNQTKQV